MIRSKTPIARADARVLILGTMPSEASLAAGQFYGHVRNGFWYIMQALFAEEGKGRVSRIDPKARLPYAQREELLRKAHVALWDVFESGHRPGSSLDSAIDLATTTPNDIAGFLTEHTGVHSVFFNGATAESFFNKAIMGSILETPALSSRDITYTRLPSTSPANASISFEGKLKAWSVVADAARDPKRPSPRHCS